MRTLRASQTRIIGGEEKKMQRITETFQVSAKPVACAFRSSGSSFGFRVIFARTGQGSPFSPADGSEPGIAEWLQSDASIRGKDRLPDGVVFARALLGWDNVRAYDA